MTTASPFASMANVLARPPRAQAAPQPSSAHDPDLAKLHTLTDRIRHVIKREGVATAGWITTECNVMGGAARIHALLSRDIDRGRILFSDGMFEWNESWNEEQAKRLAEAAQLLRHHGYTVTQPQRKATA